MSKQDDARIAKLVKRVQSKVAPAKDRSKQYDSTLRTKRAETDPETDRFFKEMKRREF